MLGAMSSLHTPAPTVAEGGLDRNYRPWPAERRPQGKDLPRWRGFQRQNRGEHRFRVHFVAH